MTHALDSDAIKHPIRLGVPYFDQIFAKYFGCSKIKILVDRRPVFLTRFGREIGARDHFALSVRQPCYAVQLSRISVCPPALQVPGCSRALRHVRSYLVRQATDNLIRNAVLVVRFQAHVAHLIDVVDHDELTIP